MPRPISEIVQELIGSLSEVRIETPMSFIVSAEDMTRVFRLRQRINNKGFAWNEQTTQHLDRVLSLLLNSPFVTENANNTICEALDLLEAREAAKEETFNP